MLYLKHLLLLLLLSLISCNNISIKPTPRTVSEDNYYSGSLVNLEDIIIDPKSSDAKIVEVYRTDIQEKCERKYIESVKAYQDGNLKVARINFDNLLEHLEYFYGDEKLSDSLMLSNFMAEFDTDKLEENDKDIFKLYSSLYSEESDDEPETELQVQENKNDSMPKPTENRSYELVKNDVKSFLATKGIKGVDEIFLKDVTDAFDEYSSDRIKTKEIIIRATKYESFIKGVLKKEGLDPFFFYIPAVMTTYYNEKNNGGIWGLDNTRSWRKIRNDVGASTALVVSMLKNRVKSSSTVQVMSEVVKERNYSFNNNFSKIQVFNSDFAGFLAIAVILNNPDRYGFKEMPESLTSEEDFSSSYLSYSQNPEEYISEKQQNISKSKKSTEKKSKKNTKIKDQLKIKYSVQKGDNLQNIAALFKADLNDIAELNPKTIKKKQLFAGTVIIIKTSGLESYKARSGDSMGKICKKFGMSVAEFQDINDLDNKKVYKGRRYYVYKN